MTRRARCLRCGLPNLYTRGAWDYNTAPDGSRICVDCGSAARAEREKAITVAEAGVPRRPRKAARPKPPG